MLWVGWYGFNSGSAVAADVIAANAFTTTTIATAVGSFVWPMWEWIVKGKPSVLGFCSGAVAGLVLITPACGYVLPSGAIWIGIAAGTIPWFFCYKVKGWLGMDDALDAGRSRHRRHVRRDHDRHVRPSGRQSEPGDQPEQICHRHNASNRN